MLAGGLMRGLTMADTRNFTLGGWIDYCLEYNAMQKAADKDAPREATQADIERLKH